ncbi:hypothetical protein DNTS_031279 [Danionella cerebrum]|uniref:Uncharacterized protein n=1 Tax=Danionella cerebrum TaxID=2873325 RepID=A0A553MNK9_9TELE|nr:hypothetical protein DNTS_031279 [Danionella translucida]
MEVGEGCKSQGGVTSVNQGYVPLTVRWRENMDLISESKSALASRLRSSRLRHEMATLSLRMRTGCCPSLRSSEPMTPPNSGPMSGEMARWPHLLGFKASRRDQACQSDTGNYGDEIKSGVKTSSAVL